MSSFNVLSMSDDVMPPADPGKDHGTVAQTGTVRAPDSALADELSRYPVDGKNYVFDLLSRAEAAIRHLEEGGTP
jgi:hypothetical protein